MRRSTIPSGSVLLTLIIALAASPASAQSGPQPLSLGDLQGFGIRPGNPGEPQRPLPTPAPPAVEPATVDMPAVVATEAAAPIVDQAAPTAQDEEVLPGIIIRARPAPPAARVTTPPAPAPQARPAAVAGLVATPGDAQAAAPTTTPPQPRPTAPPAAHAPPQPRPVPAATLPATTLPATTLPATNVPAARPPLGDRGPASLGADALEAIALKPIAAVRIVPAAVEPAPAIIDVERRPAATVMVAPTAPPPPAGAAAPSAAPATPSATRPIQLDTDALVAVGLRSSGASAP